MKNPLEIMIEHARIPGMSISAVSPSGEIVKQSVGVTNKHGAQAVTDATVFEAASLSKPVFAYLVLKMVERGMLSRPGESPESGLDRPLHEICDFGPPHLRDDPNYKLLTARRILSHQAGLPNWFKPGEPEAYVSEVGSQFNYSGVAYYALNEIVEHVSGKSLHQLSQEAFSSEPLKMSSSSFVPHEEGTLKREARAIGHDLNEVPDEREHFPRGQRPNPAASLFTTAEDYAKFLTVCIADPFVSKHMFEPQIELAGKDSKAIEAGVPPETLAHISWGLGMGLQTNESGQTIAFHWGDVETCRAFAAINLETKQAATCFTNSTNGPLIFRQIVEPVVGDLHAVSQWLQQREGLNLNSTAMYRRVMASVRDNELKVDTAPKVIDVDPAPPGEIPGPSKN